MRKIGCIVLLMAMLCMVLPASATAAINDGGLTLEELLCGGIVHTEMLLDKRASVGYDLMDLGDPGSDHGMMNMLSTLTFTPVPDIKPEDMPDTFDACLEIGLRLGFEDAVTGDMDGDLLTFKFFPDTRDILIKTPKNTGVYATDESFRIYIDNLLIELSDRFIGE